MNASIKNELANKPNPIVHLSDHSSITTVTMFVKSLVLRTGQVALTKQKVFNNIAAIVGESDLKIICHKVGFEFRQNKSRRYITFRKTVLNLDQTFFLKHVMETQT